MDEYENIKTKVQISCGVPLIIPHLDLNDCPYCDNKKHKSELTCNSIDCWKKELGI